MSDVNHTLHRRHMRLALNLAREAMAKGDWPVAAVIASERTVLATGRGRQNSRSDCLAHAELDALSQAQRVSAVVAGATLYCTMEPCPMCAWALHLNGINHIVLGARHADLGRTDLGQYTIESFAEMMGIELQLTLNIERRECLKLRLEWGQDQTR